MSNGKGDTPRPRRVTDTEYAMRWSATFAQDAEALATAWLAKAGIPRAQDATLAQPDKSQQCAGDHDSSPAA